MINQFKYGQTWKIWPSPFSLSLYITFNLQKFLICDNRYCFSVIKKNLGTSWEHLKE